MRAFRAMDLKDDEPATTYDPAADPAVDLAAGRTDETSESHP
jgi:hypothetical protein